MFMEVILLEHHELPAISFSREEALLGFHAPIGSLFKGSRLGLSLRKLNGG